MQGRHLPRLSKVGQELLLGAVGTTPLTVAESLDRSLVADALSFLWTVWTSRTPADSAHAHYEVSEKAGVGPTSDTRALWMQPYGAHPLPNQLPHSPTWQLPQVTC